MANPLLFTPNPVNPKLELQKLINAAPVEHAEALLVAWDVLQSAHDKGILDALHGLIEAKDTITGKVADYAKLPEGIAGIRNVLAAVKIFTLIDPEVLDKLYRAFDGAVKEHQKEEKPPSLWQLMKRAMSEDSRRGLSLMTLILTSMGRSTKR